jgi:hypothetical protein
MKNVKEFRQDFYSNLLSPESNFSCLKKDGCTWYSRRAGVKPPPDRAKRSIFIFSLKNPLRQLFIQVAV